MKKIIVMMTVITVVLSFSSCKTSTSTSVDTHTSKNSLDWSGRYRGTNVEGGKEVVSILNLMGNSTYEMSVIIPAPNEKVSTITGKFAWNKKGNEVTLDSPDGTKKTFLVGENQLIERDKSGNSILVMQKVQDESITEKYWKLIEINGKPVSVGENQREAYIIFKGGDEPRVSGYAGCNNFTGGYELGAPGTIKFSRMAMTMKACLDMTTESAMLKVFDTADNYTLSPDGKYLSLNRARMAPLARFEVVYLR